MVALTTSLNNWWFSIDKGKMNCYNCRINGDFMQVYEEKLGLNIIAVRISMARAFKARKELNDMIQKIRRGLNQVSPYVHEVDIPSQKSYLSTGEVMTEVVELEKLLHTKMTLDIAIEQSNVPGQIKLAQIEKCNKTIELLSYLENQVRGAKSSERFFNNTSGKYEFEELTRFMPPAEEYEKPLEAAVNLKRELEEELQKFNNETVIPVPMDSTIAGKLGLLS